MTKEYEMIIPTPDDNNSSYRIQFTCNSTNIFGNRTIPLSVDRVVGNDPILDGLANFFGNYLFPRKRTYRRYSNYSGLKELDNFVINLYGCPILLSHDTKVSINGVKHSVANAKSILARMFSKAIREKDGTKLLVYLGKLNKMPENVTYALENRAPFVFWHDYEKHEVRLNVQLIDDNAVAIEVSDGIWGNMSFKDLDAFCNAYRFDSKRSNWSYISPKELYIKTVGKEPLASEVKVMKSFLLQNRTADLVEKRARELVDEMVKKYPDRLFAEKDETGFVTALSVRGKIADWKLTAKTRSSGGRQDVATYVYGIDADSNPVYRGPICIDNLNTNSSIGDQFVARALALLNDHVVVNMVSTIKSYMPNIEVRDDNNGLPRMQR